MELPPPQTLRAKYGQREARETGNELEAQKNHGRERKLLSLKKRETSENEAGYGDCTDFPCIEGFCIFVDS